MPYSSCQDVLGSGLCARDDWGAKDVAFALKGREGKTCGKENVASSVEKYKDPRRGTDKGGEGCFWMGKMQYA